MSRRIPLIEGRRDHHVANVVPLRRINPNHPSVRPDMFDQDTAPPDQMVVFTRIEAQLIASLLHVARPHLPSPLAVDQAIELLKGKR